MEWSNETWLAIIVAFLVGTILGYVILRVTNASVQKQNELVKELKVAKNQIDAQKVELEKHFEQSASLLATLAEDYKKLYEHLSKGSQTLLPENEQIAFFTQPQLEEKKDDDDQPKDYSEGASGILKS